jgi:two-component system response regulator
MGDDKRILLVDDNPDDVDLTLRALRKNQIPNEVIVARDGAEALEYLCGSGKYAGRDVRQQPVVILLDLKLPKIDGLEVLKRIRADERTKLLPVVILTTSREPKDVENGYNFGASSYIVKPVDFQKFVTTVGEVGRYWILVNEPAP